MLYLLIHQRIGTKERGNRLMPGRFPSPACPRCLTQHEPLGIPETICHRYSECLSVISCWEWLRSKLVLLDVSILACQDIDLLSLDFERSIRENAILWMLGIYAEVIDQEVVLRGRRLDVQTITGIFKQRKLESRYQALPDLGIIPGVDFDTQGVG